VEGVEDVGEQEAEDAGGVEGEQGNNNNSPNLSV